MNEDKDPAAYAHDMLSSLASLLVYVCAAAILLLGSCRLGLVMGRGEQSDAISECERRRHQDVDACEEELAMTSGIAERCFISRGQLLLQLKGPTETSTVHSWEE